MERRHRHRQLAVDLQHRLQHELVVQVFVGDQRRVLAVAQRQLRPQVEGAGGKTFGQVHQPLGSVVEAKVQQPVVEDKGHVDKPINDGSFIFRRHH